MDNKETIMDDEYTLSVGFGFDLDDVDPENLEILIVAIGAYLNGYQRGLGVQPKPRYHRYGSKCVFYYDDISMTADDLLALRSALPDRLQSSVRLYKVAKRMSSEIVTVSVGDIEMTDMKE